MRDGSIASQNTESVVASWRTLVSIRSSDISIDFCSPIAVRLIYFCSLFDCSAPHLIIYSPDLL